MSDMGHSAEKDTPRCHGSIPVDHTLGALPDHCSACAEYIALRDRIHEAATLAINAVYGTDDRHAYMGLRIAQNALAGTPLPWKWDETTSVTPPGAQS